MSIASAITAAQGKVADCYTAISNKGGTLPATQNLSNMPTAINSIPSGGGSSKYGCTIDNMLGDVDANGKLQQPANTSGDIVFTGVKDVGTNALAYKFYGNSNLTHSVSFPDLITVSGYYGCSNMFYQCTGLISVLLPELTTVSGNSGCYFMFYGCTGLTSVSLPELTTLSNTNSAGSMFGSCYYLTNISIPKLSTATGNLALYGFVQNCTRLTSISFPLLSNINGVSVFMSAFMGCSSLSDVYFNSLTTTSFGSNINQFNSMFNSSTAQTSGTCTVHFPSNLSSTIAGLTGYPLFGGTSGRIVLAFDLPATT